MRIRVGHLFLDVAMHLIEVAQGRIYCGSQFGGMVHHGEDVMTEEACGGFSQCVCSQESESNEFWCKAQFLHVTSPSL